MSFSSKVFFETQHLLLRDDCVNHRECENKLETSESSIYGFTFQKKKMKSKWKFYFSRLKLLNLIKIFSFRFVDLKSRKQILIELKQISNHFSYTSILSQQDFPEFFKDMFFPFSPSFSKVCHAPIILT